MLIGAIIVQSQEMTVVNDHKEVALAIAGDALWVREAFSNGHLVRAISIHLENLTAEKGGDVDGTSSVNGNSSRFVEV